MDKKELRKIALDNRKKITANELKEISKIICDEVILLDEFIKADKVFVYMATEQEIDLSKIMEVCFANGKKVAVPKVTDKSKGIMEFVYINSTDDLEEGYMHISEPSSNDFIHINDTGQGIMILPGLAFDRDGHRCGYGGGFYDRYIARGYEGLKIAVCLEENVFEQIDTDEFDKKYDILITQKHLYNRMYFDE